MNGGPGVGHLEVHRRRRELARDLEAGLPEGDKGRIGITISPAAPDTLYAVVEASRDKGGFYRSTNRGESWERRSDRGTSSPQYYNEIFADPHDEGRVYLVDTFLSVTEDGGATWSNGSGITDKHVDDHFVWIDR